jgi:hypothetical protein
MRPNWITALDAFENHLNVQFELVSEGLYDEVAVFEPPAPLPALPLVLVPRASALLVRARDLTERASALLGDTSDRLAHSRRPLFTEHSVPAYIDQQA